MAVPQLLQPHHHTSSSTGDEDQSVLTYRSPPQNHGLPLKKRKFDAAPDAPFASGIGLNHEEGDSENTRRSYSSQGSIMVSSSDGMPGTIASSSEDDANATTTHRQPVHGEFSSATSKKPRTGAFGRNFIKSYVMSRDYNALTSNSMNDFMRTHQQKSVDSPQQQQQQQQQSMTDSMQTKSVDSHQQQQQQQPQQNMIDFMQNETVGSHQQQQQIHQYRFKCKTCNKSFPTFQALGGHRSSHYDETKENVRIPSSSTTTDDNAIVTVVANDHRCNICNKSFPSGRALGGHKRLHWKPFADASLLKEEMARKKKFEIVLKDNQTGGEDGINLELTL